MNIGTLTASLGINYVNLQQAHAAMQNFGNQANRTLAAIQQQMNSVSASMKRFGGDATRVLTIPLAATGAMAVDTFRKYETTLAHIEGLTGASKEQTKSWSKELERLSISVGRTPQELAESLYYIASSGVEASKAMDILTISAKSSVAGLGSTQQVANLITSAMNAYAQSGLTARTVADQLTAAVREGKIEAAQFAEHIGYVIPVASEMGVSFDQVAAAMAAMSTTGSDASTAATQLRQLLSDILKPAMQSETALKKFGSSGAELRKILKEDGLLGALGKVREMMNKFGEDAVAKVFPEVRALTGVLMLIGENSAHVKEIFKEVAMSTGNMGKAFEIVTNTLQFKFDQSVSQLRLSLIDLGKAMKGPLISILNSLSNLLKSVSYWFNSLTESQQRWVIYAGATLAVIGPLTYAIGSLIGVVGGLTGALRTLGTVMKTHPLLFFAAIIVGIGTAFFTVSTHTERAAEAQRKYNEQLERMNEIKATVEGISDQMLALGDLNKMQVSTLQSTIQTQLNSLTSYSAIAFAKYKNAWSEYSKWLLYSGKNSLTEQQRTDMIRWLELSKNYQKEATSYNERIKLLEGYLSTVDKKLSGMKDATSIGTGNTGIIDIMAKMAKEEQKITDKAALMANGFNKNQELISLYSKTLDQLLDAGLKPTSNYVEDVANKFNDLSSTVELANQMITNIEATLDGLSPEALGMLKSFEDQETQTKKLNKVYKELQGELAYIQFQESLLGDTYDAVGEQVNAYKKKIDTLYEKGLTPESDTGMAKMISEFKALLLIQEQTAISAEHLKSIYQAIGDASVSILFDVGKSISGQTDAWMSMVDAVLGGLQQIISMLLAQAIAGMLAGEAKKGLLGLVTGAVGVGVLLGMWENYKSKASGAAKMANGGVVPGGYPNDTYPAMLSSNEVVVPPGKLDKLINQNQQSGGRVVFEIDGYKLRGILEKELKKSRKV